MSGESAQRSRRIPPTAEPPGRLRAGLRRSRQSVQAAATVAILIANEHRSASPGSACRFAVEFGSADSRADADRCHGRLPRAAGHDRDASRRFGRRLRLPGGGGSTPTRWVIYVTTA